jgi:molybdenum cofactor guanylyltransferase
MPPAGSVRVGGVVLCGGKSSRMGYPKALLPFGSELMLQRVVRLLGEVATPLIVVASGEQALPPLPANVQLARDERPHRGPLEGLLAGLTALGDRADAAYVTSCDVPLLTPAFVRAMIDRLAEHDIAVPFDDSFHHPLAAVYRVSVKREVARLLADDKLRPVFLFDCVDTVRVPVDELRSVDPELHTLRNLNQPADYFAALAIAGFQPPPDFQLMREN